MYIYSLVKKSMITKAMNMQITYGLDDWMCTYNIYIYIYIEKRLK